jgi:phytoene dehydrogenase-like protein
MSTAHVVGAGPNGLSAAIALRHAGWSVTVLERAETIGGAARSEAVTLPGFIHDIGAGVHPFGAASPFFAALPLSDHGLAWAQPDIPLAHPLDGGRAAVVYRSLDETVEGLKQDGRVYRRVVGQVVEHWTDLEPFILGPLVQVPRHPIRLGVFGLTALQPVSWVLRGVRTEEARALFAGLAAHAPMPLDRLTNTAVGAALAACAHRGGWPVARGGSQSIVDSLGSYLISIGGEIVTGMDVTDLTDLDGTVLFDTGPRAVARIAGNRLPDRLRQRFATYEHGPGIFKTDFALAGPMPWESEPCRRAGTLHIGGSAEEIAAAERAVWEGHPPEKPFIVAAQPTVADPSRAPEGRHVLWAYCRVPNGSEVDMADAIERQIERFAPGFRDIVLDRHITTPHQLEQWNPNLVGGDIAGGRTDRLRTIIRPRPAVDPYHLADGLYLCSSSAPPGPGVHGMAGFHAAQSVLRHAK